MSTFEQVIEIPIYPAEVAFLRGLASKAEIGGRSQIRSGADRRENLEQDQLVGQIGNYAGHKHFFGNANLYRISRWYADIYPTMGDGGSDVPGANIDFKASRLKPGRSVTDYRLLVRPAERHPGTVYVLIVVDLDADPVKAHLVGWAAEHELPAETLTTGPLAGAYALPAAELHPLPPIQWYKAA